MLQRISGLALFAALFSSVIPAAEASWETDQFNIVVRDQSLSDVLVQFGALAGVPVVISDGVEGSVSARFEGATGEEIIAALAREYALDWRYDGRRIEVSANSEQVSRILDMGGVQRSSLVGALSALGAHEPRFPITAIDGQLALIVGPPRYVGIVEIVLAELVDKKMADDSRLLEQRQQARLLAKEERAEAERRAEVERAQALEALRLQAALAAQMRLAPAVKPVEPTGPLINRGGRWGG